MNRAIVVTCVLLPSFPGSTAACPDGLDVGEAFALVRSVDGFTERVTRTGQDELTVERWTSAPEADAPAEVVTTYRGGVYPTRRESAGRVVTSEYEALPSITGLLPGRIVSSRFEALEGDAVIASGHEISSTDVFEPTAVRLGECDYEGLTFLTRTTIEGGATIAFERVFVPELGYVVSAVRLDEDDEPISGVVFDRIEAIERDGQ